MHPKLPCPSLSRAIDLRFRTRSPRGSVGIQIVHVSSHCRNDHRGANGDYSSKDESVFHGFLGAWSPTRWTVLGSMIKKPATNNLMKPRSMAGLSSQRRPAAELRNSKSYYLSLQRLKREH